MIATRNLVSMYSQFFHVYKLRLAFFAGFFVFLFVSCDSEWKTGADSEIAFSMDTLTFDTVFSGIGSSTSKFLVYNKSDQMIHFQAYLAGGSESAFRLNMDGAVNVDHQFDDLFLAPNDSMYVFVEVNIDTKDVNSSILVDDSIVFVTDDIRKSVRLEAFGKDMILLSNYKIQNDTVLTAEKAFLIYGDLVLDSGKVLNISAGCALYFHQNASLVVNGTLRVNGTQDKPVLMQGDRFDAVRFTTPVPYQNVSGQWGGVFLLNPGARHVINYLNLRSAYVGLYSPNNDWSNKTNIRVTNSKIHNLTFYGLVAVNTDLQIYNSEISNSGSYTVYLNGGKHTFIHSTIANFFNRKAGVQPVSRENHPAVMIMDLNKAASMEIAFRNCVIAGYNSSELSLASKYTEKLNVIFENCYISRTVPYAYDFFTDVLWSNPQDTVFVSAAYDFETGEYFNFNPDSVSPIRGIANPLYSKLLPVDLNGRNRMEDGSPDVGAYEWFAD